MTSNLAVIFEDFSAILAICPCCGEVFRLGDARPFLKGHKLATPFDHLEQATRLLGIQEQGIQEKLARVRARARARGLSRAKRKLRQIDPVFCGSGIDPQDVNVIFDPVPYVVFDGMSAKSLRRILLVAEEPESRALEQVVNAVDRAIHKGHAEFVTLRVAEDGAVVREP